MGKELFESNSQAMDFFEQANDALGFRITDIMFEGSDDDLRQTKVTQPAIYIHSIILTLISGNFNPDLVAGHSLGEFSALVANNSLSFEDGLSLVAKRAKAMQKACELNPSTMAAIIGLQDEVVERICNSIDEVVAPANYNCPGQIVISGSLEGIKQACEKLTEAGARRALQLPVGGAFHSPLMEPARAELEAAILETNFSAPTCPVYQNATAKPSMDVNDIKNNLTKQLTAPVLWAQSVECMVSDGATHFIESGPGKVLQGLVRKVNREVEVSSILF
jgi:[acyl-carrier-protein] S-malonyltransferase